ncbi:MAG TPA: FtsQ-type POTRA domain-containing protein [Acidimicrobiales bacterium]|nr:FtsQ-type POTRA domain-containing protein [Acidimicrobiales bacterium]
MAARTSSRSRVAIDPRIRSRRIAVQRDQWRRRLKRLSVVLSGIALAVAGLVATQTPLLDVDRVRVEGAARTDPGEVLRRARIGRGDTMVGVDTGQAAARIEDLPWVERATIVRRWPGTIEIDVTEREPLALVEMAEGRTAVVDREGRVLEVTIEPPSGVPLVTGVRAPTAEGEELGRGARDALVLLRALRERLPGTVASVSSDLDAALAAGGEVRFGSVEDLDDKIVAMETVLGDVDTTCLELLDVRVPGSPALTRHQRCS